MSSTPDGLRSDRLWPVRILAVSDLHFRLPHYDWLVRASADADVVTLSGDLANVASPVPIDVQAVVLGKYLATLSTNAMVLAASGNHDLDGPGPHGEQVAGWLRRAGDERRAHRRGQCRYRRRPLHDLPLVGWSADA